MNEIFKFVKNMYNKALEIKKQHKGKLITRVFINEEKEYERDFRGAGVKNLASEDREIVYYENVILEKIKEEDKIIAPEILNSGRDHTIWYKVKLEPGKQIGAYIATDYHSNIDGYITKQVELVFLVNSQELSKEVYRALEIIPKQQSYHLWINAYIYSNTWQGGFVISVKQRKILKPHAKFERAVHYWLLPGWYIVVEANGHYVYGCTFTVGLIQVYRSNEEEILKIRGYDRVTFEINDMSNRPKIESDHPLITAFEKIKNEVIGLSGCPYHTIPEPDPVEFTKQEIKALIKFLRDGKINL